MNRISSIATLAAVLGGLLAASAQAAISRTYVASTGLDTNTTFSCDFAHPCRTFQVALSQTTPGGEVLALDGSGYGRLVIDKSVSIIANGGVFAGIGAPAGTNGIEIATAGVKVVLRGLTVNGLGGSYGILMSDGATLTVQSCDVSGFGAPDGAGWGDIGPAGIYMKTAARVVISDTRVANNSFGIRFARGANAELVRVQATGNYVGIAAVGDATDTILTTVSVSDSLVSHNASSTAVGVFAAANWFGCSGCTAKMTVTNSVASFNSSAVLVYSASTLTASGNRMVGNVSNLVNGGGTVNSAMNNVVSGGTSSGGITNVSGSVFQ